LLNLDAVLDGGPVTVASDQVTWEGVELTTAGVIFCERLLFPWPQPHRILTGPVGDGSLDRLVGSEREAMSLSISALLVAGRHVPILPAPPAALLAANPLLALDRCQAGGRAVVPWRLSGAPTGDDSSAADVLLLDPAGEDRWHRPQRPVVGGFGVQFPDFSGTVTEVLVIGGQASGDRTFACPGDWLTDRGGRTTGVPESATELACQVAAELDLAFCVVTLAASGSRILWIQASPDLQVWDDRTGGRVAASIAQELAAQAGAAASPGKETPA
jgi:hypothetical protein